MKESIERACNGCWAIMMASLRMILFLGTVLYLFFATLLFLHSTLIENSLMVDPQKASRFSVIFYINNGFNCLVALFGFYSLITNSPVALRRYSSMIMATTIMLSLYLIFGTAYRSDITDARNEYLLRLNTYMSSYDWSSSDNEKSSNQEGRATKAWDSAQSESCCGIDGYKDWDKFRPENIKSGFYPKSCCPVAHSMSEDHPGLFCLEDSDLYRKGCAKLGAHFWSMILIYYTVFLIYQLTIGTLAWFYYKQMKTAGGIILGRGINSINNRQCTPEIPISWPSSQSQSNQFENNFSSPIYPNINLSYQESPPPYASATNAPHVHKI